jgi:hypothetical protein
MGAECGRRWPILRLLFGIECSQARLPSFASIARWACFQASSLGMPAHAGDGGALRRTWKAARAGGALRSLRYILKMQMGVLLRRERPSALWGNNGGTG